MYRLIVVTPYLSDETGEALDFTQDDEDGPHSPIRILYIDTVECVTLMVKHGEHIGNVNNSL
jgi:anti-sigma factor ChrR (cupin superfamily)